MERLEARMPANKPGMLRSGYLTRLPEDHTGERHVVVVSLHAASSYVIITKGGISTGRGSMAGDSRHPARVLSQKMVAAVFLGSGDLGRRKRTQTVL